MTTDLYSFYLIDAASNQSSLEGHCPFGRKERRICEARAGGMNSQQLRREGSAASLLSDSNSVSDSVLDGIGAKKRRRHAFQTRTALLLSGTTVCLLALFALFSSSDHAAFSWFAADERQGRALEEDQDDNDDYSSYSCSDILATTQDGSAARCAFARTCNGGDGVFAPVVFCSAHGKGWLAAMA
eukprot:scaffold41034_cov45-Attheya_sp.AAC.1